MLADFHPKGELGKKLGLYNAEGGFDLRATVLIDADGVVRHASIADGQRDMNEFAKLCEDNDANYQGTLPSIEKPTGMQEATLYIRNYCGASKAAVLAKENLHANAVTVRNVSEDAAAMSALTDATGAQTAPVLVTGDTIVRESAAIVGTIVNAYSKL